MDLPKVISSNQEALIVSPADRVDVSAVWPVGPQAWGEERAVEMYIKCILKLKHTPEEAERVRGAFTYRTPGSQECRCSRPTQYLSWSPHWPPVYTLMGSLRKWTQHPPTEKNQKLVSWVLLFWHCFSAPTSLQKLALVNTSFVCTERSICWILLRIQNISMKFMTHDLMCELMLLMSYEFLLLTIKKVTATSTERRKWLNSKFWPLIKIHMLTANIQQIPSLVLIWCNTDMVRQQ